ncbi:MAG: hypothetical protein PHQ86_01890 [Dehalococcoidales bacterium]|nr:hypothetical protein [Dehalococcoidales bacterium]
MGKLKYLSPPLLAIFTVTSLYAANAERLEWTQIFIPLMLASTVSCLFMLLFWLLKYTSINMPFVASVFTIVILCWNIMPVWLDIMLLVLSLIFSLQNHFKLRIEILSLILIIANLVSIGQGIFNHLNNKVNIQTTQIGIAKEGSPNIYFIVPDRMPSIDAMRESGIDCDIFLQALTERGFYVKTNQLSADEYYPINPPDVDSTRTMRYFASVLNEGLYIPLNIEYKSCLFNIKNGSIFKKLHELGYTTCNVATWFSETSNLPVDYNYRFKYITFLERIFQDELSIAFFDRTIFNGLNLRVLESTSSQNSIERKRLQWQFDEVTKISRSNGGPIFTLAHLMLPHEPYIYADSRLGRVVQYYQEIIYAQDYLIRLIDSIREYDTDAVIIIQSDEGMAYAKPVELNYDLSNTQWNGVLTAWYIPGADKSILSEIKHTEILKYLIWDLYT